MVEYSVILPAYNEEDYLETCVSKVITHMGERDYEIIIVEDGCTDKTPEIAEELSENNKKIIHIHSNPRLGRGGALRRAFNKSNGGKIIYMDVDLATDIGHLEDLIEESDNHDIVTGSRRLRDSESFRPPLRDFVSKVYHGMIRYLFGVQLSDVQCGFKLFSSEATESIETEEDSWAWDTEVMVKAAKQGYSIKEVPVRWEEKRRNRTPLLRLIKDVYIHGTLLARLWFEIVGGKK